MPETNSCCFFFFNDTATTEIYTLSLHDALPICAINEYKIILSGVSYWSREDGIIINQILEETLKKSIWTNLYWDNRSEEHTSELQSRQYLVCRLLLEKKKIILSIYVFYTVYSMT